MIDKVGEAERIAVLVVDLLEGFCRIGPLASSRVKAIVEPIVRLLEASYRLGVRTFLFTCDSHPVDSPEFDAFPAHCIEGSPEAELVKELGDLPFSEQFKVFPKYSIDSFVKTGLWDYLRDEEGVNTFLVVGDCTDLCLYEAAMGLRCHANAYHKKWEIIVPATMAATYDLPISVAQEMGALAHSGDILQLVFLHQMELNGITVVKDIIC